MAGVQLHRTRDRRHLEVIVRVERLEEDADVVEFSVAELGDKLDSFNARLTGLIVAAASSAVLLAANLVLTHIGR